MIVVTSPTSWANTANQAAAAIAAPISSEEGRLRGCSAPCETSLRGTSFRGSRAETGEATSPGRARCGWTPIGAPPKAARAPEPCEAMNAARLIPTAHVTKADAHGRDDDGGDEHPDARSDSGFDRQPIGRLLRFYTRRHTDGCAKRRAEDGNGQAREGCRRNRPPARQSVPRATAYITIRLVVLCIHVSPPKERRQRSCHAAMLHDRNALSRALGN